MAKRFLFSLLTVLLFFGVVEIGLALFGVSTLLSERDPFRGFSQRVRVYEANRDRGVFATPRRAIQHSFNYQEFALDKPESGFRFFVIGGSSAFGFPWGASAAFPHLLEQALQGSWPERVVEGINAGAMSYGSHRLRVLAHELMDYEPDLLIVYGGHNEFVERHFYDSLLARQPQLDGLRYLLSGSRLYSAMTRAYEGLAADKAGAEAETTSSTAELLGLDVDRDESGDIGDQVRQEVRRQFEENLRQIVTLAQRRQVPVILCTVPSNVTGWKPNQSAFSKEVSFEERAQLQRLLGAAAEALETQAFEQAIQHLEAGQAIEPQHAELKFQLGQGYLGAGRLDEARQAFVSARDADSRPSRATSALNEAIRQVAADTGAMLVDAERLFEAWAPDGLLGFNLFEDYVHPNPQGHRILAFLLWEQIQQQQLLGSAIGADLAMFEGLLEIDGLADVGDHDQPPSSATQAVTPNLLFNLAVVLENQGLDEQAMDKYRACIELNPEYYLARENLARLLFRRGRFAEAAVAYRRVLDSRPERVEALVGLGESLRRVGQNSRAEQVLRQATAIDPDSAAAWNSLGGLLSQLGRQADAEVAFRRAVDCDPEDSDARVNLGLSLLFQNRLDEAEQLFRQVLEGSPDQLRARNGLAATLTEQGDFATAERLFRETLAVEPSNNFAQGGLELIRKKREAQ